MERSIQGRRIMHVDMDAFYASVEQADRPELKGGAVIVGGGKRGVVSAASYEARKYGVHSAMPIFLARRLCPQGTFLPVRMKRYKEASRQVMEVLAAVSPLVEQISIDEAFIDISGTEALFGEPVHLARRVKRAILEKTSLTCSVGIAPNKFLAKIASDMHKPDGLTVVEVSDVPDFLKTLPIEKVPGVGAKTAQGLKELGVRFASDVLRLPLSFWVGRLGKAGVKLFEKAQGIDPSPVEPSSEAKSCSAEDTFEEDTQDTATLEKWLMIQSETVGRELRETGVRARTVTLKIKYADFTAITRSRTLREPTDCTQTIFDSAAGLLRGLTLASKVRLIGVGASNLSREARQTMLFPDSRSVSQEKLDRAMDKIHDKFGQKVLRRGRTLDS